MMPQVRIDRVVKEILGDDDRPWWVDPQQERDGVISVAIRRTDRADACTSVEIPNWLPTALPARDLATVLFELTKDAMKVLFPAPTPRFRIGTKPSPRRLVRTATR